MHLCSQVQPEAKTVKPTAMNGERVS